MGEVTLQMRFFFKWWEETTHFCGIMSPWSCWKSPCHAFTSSSCSLREKSSLSVFCKCGEPWTPINQSKIIPLQYFYQIFLTLILRDSRSCVTVPNCEKNCFIWGSKKPCGMLPTYTTPGVIISGFYQKKKCHESVFNNCIVYIV